MDIDVAALRALERERDISLDVLIPAIEQALLVAYHRTDGSYRIARVELDRVRIERVHPPPGDRLQVRARLGRAVISGCHVRAR